MVNQIMIKYTNNDAWSATFTACCLPVCLISWILELQDTFYLFIFVFVLLKKIISAKLNSIYNTYAPIILNR